MKRYIIYAMKIFAKRQTAKQTDHLTLMHNMKKNTDILYMNTYHIPLSIH